MNWLHFTLVAASAVEACSGVGTYVLSMMELAACLWQFVLASWLSIE